MHDPTFLPRMLISRHLLGDLSDLWVSCSEDRANLLVLFFSFKTLYVLYVLCPSHLSLYVLDDFETYVNFRFCQNLLIYKRLSSELFIYIILYYVC